MNEKIAFPQLVELVAEKASTTERMSELFLQELFTVISKELIDGKSVKINGLGTFKTTKGDHDKEVVFVPDKDIAEDINAPFSQFKPVVLCDAITIEQLNEIDDSIMQPEPAATTIVEPVEPAEEIDEGAANNKIEQEENVEVAQEPQQEEPALPIKESPTETIDKHNGKRKWLTIAAAIAAIALIAGFATHYLKKGNTETVAQTDSVATPRPVPKPVVTDTLRNNNLIFDMARKHYGDQAFWVYIALENQKQYPDYNKIPMGATLVIPPAEKYGINSDSKKSLKDAGIEAMKLYNQVKASKTSAEPAVEIKQEDDTTSTKPLTTITKAKRLKPVRKQYRPHNLYRNRHRRR